MYDRAIAKYITLSQFVKDAMLLAGYDEKKICVIPPAAGTLLAHEYYSHARDKKAYLFAGRLENYKGISLYLQLAEKSPEHIFYVAGTGPLEADVRQAEAAHGNVRYLGFLEAKSLWEKMAGVNAVIVPSLWYEAYGLVSLEAMSLGTPVLVSDRGGLPELVRASKGGKVFKAGDLKDLLKKFKELEDQKVWSEMSVNARSYTGDKNSPQAFLTEILKAYDSVRTYE
jgi:glycosyltransferase involved in cell wall biosynthesis